MSDASMGIEQGTVSPSSENVIPTQIAPEADLSVSMRPTVLLENILGNSRIIKALVTNSPEKPSILAEAKQKIDNLTQQEKLTFLEQAFSISCDPVDDPDLRDATLELLSVVDLTSIDRQKLTESYLQQGYDLLEGLNENSDPYGEIYGFLEIGKIIAPFIAGNEIRILQSVLNKLALKFEGDDLKYVRTEIATIRQNAPSELSETEKQVLELANNGLSNQEIGVKLGLLQPEVRRIIQRLQPNIVAPDSRARGYRQPEVHNIGLRNKVRELRNKNLNDQEISRILGISLQDVTRISSILIKTGEIKKLTRGTKPRKSKKEQEEIESVIAQEQERLSRTLKFHRTLSFLRISRCEAAHLKKPDSIPQDIWERNSNILKEYYRTSVTQLDIARKYHVSSPSVNQIIHKMTQIYWNNCSAQTQAEYPFEELILRKPLPQRSRERKSALQGGTMLKIRAKLAEGKSLAGSLKELGITPENITTYRRRLQSWGVEAPYVYTPPRGDNKELERQLRIVNEDSKKQELLNQVRMRFYTKHVRGDNPLLISIARTTIEAGFAPYIKNLSPFINPLEDIGFPMGEIETLDRKRKIKLHFILTQDKKRAQALWLGNEDLKRYLKKPTRPISPRNQETMPT